MMPGRAASSASATAGGPSMMIATQRICRAVNGSGRPMSGAKKTVRIAPMVVDNRKRTDKIVVCQDHGRCLFGDCRPPIPTATPMSACFSADASLTPSPVIATTSPLACSARTIFTLCAGVTRAKTAMPLIASANCTVSSRSSSAPEIARPCNPSCAAIAEAVV